MFYDRDSIDIKECAFKGRCFARMFCRAGIQHGKGAVADCWSNRFLFPGSIRREEVDCLAADLGRKSYGKDNEGYSTGASSFRRGRSAPTA